MSEPCEQFTFHGCSVLQSSYQIQEKLGEGTFGEVHKAVHSSSKKLVALKKIFLHNEKEGFPITALREIRILKDLDHPNIIDLMDMSLERGDRAQRKRTTVYMVTPYMEHDLAGLLSNLSVQFTLGQIKTYMDQLLRGIDYMHQKRYLHRDIKAANLLIDNRGNLKIADFGLARRYLEPPPTVAGAGPGVHSYTVLVVTRWYRPPELILGDAKYTTAIDMWGIGCVFGEMFRKRPILQGNSDLDQGCKIFELLGSPNEENMPGYEALIKQKNFTFGPYVRKLEYVFQDLPPQALSLLSGLLTLDPLRRLSALGALNHDFFRSDPPATPKDKLPTYSDSHELNSKQKGHPPHPPNPSHANNTLPEQYVADAYWNQPPGEQHHSHQPSRKRHRHNNHQRYDYQDHQGSGRRRRYENAPPYRQHAPGGPPYRQHDGPPYREQAPDVRPYRQQVTDASLHRYNAPGIPGAPTGPRRHGANALALGGRQNDHGNRNSHNGSGGRNYLSNHSQALPPGAPLGLPPGPPPSPPPFPPGLPPGPPGLPSGLQPLPNTSSHTPSVPYRKQQRNPLAPPYRVNTLDYGDD